MALIDDTTLELALGIIKSEFNRVDGIIANANSFDIIVCDTNTASTVPNIVTGGTLAPSASTTQKMYLVSDRNSGADKFDEYVTVQNGNSYSWEKLGSINEVDISGKADKSGTVLTTTLERGKKSGTTLGTGALAFGNNVEASGNYSQAFGNATKATGASAHAEGMAFTTSSISVATQATGNASHAEGRGAKASGMASHAEGEQTVASGANCHAEGSGTRAGTGNELAESIASHAEGMSTIASGIGAHSEGYYSTASGLFSHAEGNNTTSSGLYSHAEGQETISNAYAMHTQGIYNVADTLYVEWVSGTSYSVGDKVIHDGIGYSCVTANSDADWDDSNWTELLFTSDNKTAFVIGNGTENVRSNAMRVDYDGNEELAGGLKYGTILRPHVYTGTNASVTGSAGSSSDPYVPTKWVFDTGITPHAGDVIFIIVPVAGISSGVWMSIQNGASNTYYPVALKDSSRFTTHFAAGATVMLVFEENAVTKLYGNTESGGAAGASLVEYTTNRWSVLNYYNSDTNTKMTVGKTTSDSDRPLLAADRVHSSITSGSAYGGSIPSTASNAPTVNTSTGLVKVKNIQSVGDVKAAMTFTLGSSSMYEEDLQSMMNILSSLAPVYNANTTYSAGDCFVYNGKLLKCKMTYDTSTSPSPATLISDDDYRYFEPTTLFEMIKSAYALSSVIAPAFDINDTYSSGDYFMYNGKLYKVTASYNPQYSSSIDTLIADNDDQYFEETTLAQMLSNH